MKAGLKGGLIGTGIGVLVVLVAFLLASSIGIESDIMIVFAILSAPTSFVIFFALLVINNFLYNFYDIELISGPLPELGFLFLSIPLGILINSFMIGVLIGLIIQKIKPKVKKK